MAYIRDAPAPEYGVQVATRRGRVASILKVHGIEPEIGRAHLALYLAI